MRRRSVVFWLSVLIAGPFANGRSRGQQPNPEAPVLAMPAPMGMQRGTSLDLTLTGTNLREPTALWTSFPAKASFPPCKNDDSTHLLIRLQVPADAPLGFQALRLATRRGLSNLRIFCIDDLPQVLRTENDHSRDTAQRLTFPCVVAGRIDAETSDYYRIHVRGGQRVSFEILGRRLGSGLDPQISLYDLTGLHELPSGHSNDAPGLQTDSRLTYFFKKAGDYLVEVRDTRWAGGPEYWYRLRVGDFPCATTPVPMAARRGTQVSVGFTGPMVEGVPPVNITVPSDPLTQALWVAPRGSNGLHGWPVVLAVSDYPEAVEHEPNDTPAHADRVPVPGGITARFQAKEDIDRFVFAAKKAHRYVIEAQSHQWFSPTDVRMALSDAHGSVLAQSNPQLPSPLDQRIDFTAPADGDYFVAAEHLLGSWGPSECYRLVIEPYEPGFDVTLDMDRYDVPAGGIVPIPVTAVRRDFNGPIKLCVTGSTPFQGEGVIYPGESSALLFVRCPDSVAPGAHALAVEAKAMIDGQPVTAYANVRAAISRELAGLPFPPPMLVDEFGLAVTDAAPFTLSVSLPRADLFRGGELPVTIKARRGSKFTGEIDLAPLGLPPVLSVTPNNIASGKDAATIDVKTAATAPLRPFSVDFLGKARFHDRDYTIAAAPGVLNVVSPFQLHVAKAPVKIARGGKVKLLVSAIRGGGYQGPIALEVQNLPPHVAAAKAAIAAAKSAIEIELAATGDAKIGEHSDAQIVGTAVGAEKQHDFSDSFGVTVDKRQTATASDLPRRTKHP